MPLPLLALAAGAGAGLFKAFQGIHQNNLANRIVVPDANYETSPYAIKMLDEANRIKDSRMKGQAEAERNIYGSQSNATGAIGRNATSGSQALALIAAINGNTNNAFNNLRSQEGNDFWMKQNAFNNANQVMIGEGDKTYQDAVRKREEAIQEKMSLRGAGTQNIGGGINDIINNAFMYSSLKGDK